MTEEVLFETPVVDLGEGPSNPQPGESPVETKNPNHTPDDQAEQQPEKTTGDPIMRFVVQNFEQINTMYSAFSSKRKESTPRLLVDEPNEEQLIIEPWKSDSEEAPTNPGPKTSERDVRTNQPQKKV